MSETEQKTAFVIQPITANEELYPNDPLHFRHVYEYLFEPVLKKLNFEPSFPEVKGSEIIHASIIQNLETADLVLCDMSLLNPNVFFELGIRTALNKPVCLIKDDKTKIIPFDTSIISYHTYKSNLEPWSLSEEKSKLEKHIKSTLEKRSESNALWDVFGLKISGDSLQPEESGDENLKLKNSLLELKIRQLEEEKSYSAPVSSVEAFYHKCSNCGFGFKLNNYTYIDPLHYGINPKILPVTTVTYSKGKIKQEVVTCPKCGNVDAI